MDDDVVQLTVMFKNDIFDSDSLSNNKLSTSFTVKDFIGGLNKNDPYQITWKSESYNYDIENEIVSTYEYSK